MPPDQKRCTILTNIPLDFIRASEDLRCNPDKSTPYRTENQENWRKPSSQGQRRYLCSSSSVRSFRKVVVRNNGMLFVNCGRYKTNWQTESLSMQRRFGTPFDGPVIQFGAEICCDPISTKDKSRLHQLGTEMFPEIFIGVQRSWKQEIAGSNRLSLSRWFHEARRSRTTSNLTSPES